MPLSHPLGWLRSKNQKITVLVSRTQTPCAPSGGTYSGAAAVEDGLAVPQKTKHGTTT